MVIERERCEERLSCGVVFVTEFYKLREARSQAAIHERRRLLHEKVHVLVEHLGDLDVDRVDELVDVGNLHVDLPLSPNQMGLADMWIDYRGDCHVENLFRVPIEKVKS